MSLILHLSDLHLGSPSPIQYAYTDKFGLEVGAGDTGTDHLRRTLSALAKRLGQLGRPLDAVVVSGDLTNANQSDGYAAFPGLLGLLGDALPPPGRIVIAPGNHDADWRVQQGEPKKFRRFLETVRIGYCTPLMLGVDYETKGFKAPRGGYNKAKPVLQLPDAVVVAISSADFCGVERERTKTEKALLDNYLAEERASTNAAERDSAEKRWKHVDDELRPLRVVDMARVDPRQLEKLGGLLDSVLPTEADEDPRVRIAVLHHPIGPVFEEEEIKPFESITNLSAVRSFLLRRNFHLVLHGHKHESYVGWDWLAEPSDEQATTQWRTFVICSPGRFRRGETVCRLIDTRPGGDRPVAGAPRFSFVSVKGVGPGQRLPHDLNGQPICLAQPFARSENPAAPWIVRARTADAAYQQLRDLRVHERPRQIISIVEDPESTETLPSNYPDGRDDHWLSNLVQWWQHPRPEAIRAYLGSKYNHGERLYGDPDPIASAARALPSSKSIALLISPQEAADPDREYPALTAVQLQSRSDASGTRIDVLGIFRKQDLELWWPVNMAELAHIQRKALEAAATTSLPKPLSAGRLVAMTSSGVKENVLPQIAGTTLDRSIDLEPAFMQRLAYLAIQPSAETIPMWERALADIGTVSENLVLVPSIGTERLIAAVDLVRALGHSSAKLTTLAKRLQVLAERAREAQGALGEQSIRTPPSPQRAGYWSRELRNDAEQVMAAVRTCAKGTPGT